ncbi:hypothetical protein FQA39_LY09435 [Lamprigera yunnana]|nr:hypothetical protein FQA39_LY09435 [Lamprigera yunnana]
MDFFKTKRNAEACSYRGFCYRVDRVSENRKCWRCLKEGCNGKLWSLLNNTTPQERGEHNHLADPEGADLKNILSEMKDRARTSRVPISTVYQKAVATASTTPALAAVFPTMRSADTVLYRARHTNSTPLPKNLNEVRIPDNLRTTVTGKNFLAHENEDRKCSYYRFEVKPVAEDVYYERVRYAQLCADINLMMHRCHYFNVYE